MIKKIVFLYPTLDISGPRSIRTRNFARILGRENAVTVVSFETVQHKVDIPGVPVVRVNPPVFIRKFFDASPEEHSGTELWKHFKTVLKHFSKRFFFPDPWVRAHRVLLNQVKKDASIFTPDIIIAEMGPYSTGACALEWKRKCASYPKVILDIGDSITNNAAGMRPSGKAMKYEKNLLEQADGIVVSNGETKEYFQSAYDLREDTIAVISQGVSKDFVRECGRKEQKREGQTSLFYAGAFYPEFRDPSEFLRAFEIFGNPDIRLTLVDRLGFIKRREKNPRIEILGPMPQEALRKYYRSADILLFFDNAYGIQTPGKIYELLALRKPILFISENKRSPARQLTKTYKNVWYSRNKAEDIARALRQITSSYFEADYEIDAFFWEARAEEWNKILSISYQN